MGNFKEKVTFLDCALTGKKYKDILHTWKNQTQHHNPLQWALADDAYYLSDGGYSRVACTDYGNGQDYLFLTSNSREEVKATWERCKELIQDIEDEINQAILKEI